MKKLIKILEQSAKILENYVELANFTQTTNFYTPDLPKQYF